MRILAIDLGDVRTGLAICDKGEMLASPIGVITERSRERLADTIVQIAKEEGAEQLVLGHPINMNGSLGPRSQLVRDFAELLATKTELPIDLVDERATTVRAHQILSTTNVRGQKRKQTADAVAAVLILETYMQRRKNAGGQ
jgi:putative Holliday junction resolvase